MHRKTLVAAALLVLLTILLASNPTDAFSDQTGIYARIDKVIMEPDSTSPERIQVWGAFSLANKEDRITYDPVQRGYLYFSCKAGKEEMCRKEWADLKSVAGTETIVGFGGRSLYLPRVRKTDEKVAKPDEYPLNYGVIKVSERRSGYPPIVELKALPRVKN